MSNGFILLVEDNPDDEELTLMGLKKCGVADDCYVTRDGEEALHFLLGEEKYKNREPSELPAVILLDLKLPKLDGLEVLKRIRSNDLTKYVPVVIFTSSSEEKDIAAGYKYGVNSFVRKPIEFKEFNDTVRQLGLYWMSLNEPPSVCN